MVDKQLINGLKYEKLTEEQLYDLSQWEIVDIILAYRKDLKAKEQECEELKKECAWVKESCTLNEGINYDIWYNQKTKLDQLKTEKQGLIKDWEEKKNLAYEIACKNEKLKKALTEIKEIADKQIPYLDIDKAKSLIELEYDYAGKIYDLEQRMYKILQKISEVLE